MPVKPIHLKIAYKEIENLSDRTVRKVHKSLAKICRRTLNTEINYLLREFDLDRRELQSIRDKVANKIQSEPVYYLNYFRKGSLEVEIVLAASSIWLLQSTLGETVKEAWKEAAVHRRIIDWVKSFRAEKVTEILDEELKRVDVLPDRVYVASVELFEEDECMVVQIDLAKYESTKLVQERAIDDHLVIEISEKRIEDLGE